jgi:hypothetical protein
MSGQERVIPVCAEDGFTVVDGTRSHPMTARPLLLLARSRRSPSLFAGPIAGAVRDDVVYETGPRRDPWHLPRPRPRRRPAHTGPDLGFLWSGRRDSNPRSPPWQGS